MAEQFDILLEVQAHDTAIDQLHRRSATLPERVALTEVAAKRQALATERAEVQRSWDDLAIRQTALEEQIAASAQRRHALEERMSSGVPGPRDLEAMDHEVHQLAERQSAFEDDELVLMEEQEPLDERLAALDVADAELAAEAQRLEGAVSQAETEIMRAVADEEAARSERAAGLEPELAERYEGLRARLGGVGAARLVGDRCNGCHLTLASVEIERLRRLPDDALATCPECDRILVH